MTVCKIFLLVLSLMPFAVSAQSVEVKKETSRIEGENATGYQVSIAAPEEEVKSSLTKYLKLTGKTKVSGDYVTISEPLIGGKKYTTTLYSSAKQAGATTSAWIGVRAEGGEESSLDSDLRKLVYDFGVAFYREKIQVQIDESIRALQAVEKQQVRLVNQNKDLINKIENNKREKIELEQSLIKNKVELEDLTKKLQGNIKARDSVAVATEQIRKVVEMHKERQRRVK